MPEAIEIEDAKRNTPSLLVTQSEGRERTEDQRGVLPSIRVECGCCDGAFEIYHNRKPTGDPSMDVLDIHGVHGTVDQWRKLFLPHLGMGRLQEARDELLELRDLLGKVYDSLPAPDKVLRHVDKAIDWIPGEGEPSTAPY